jgi:archaellum component FlaF (FlaF/FlaG flagellin family)
MGGTKQHLSHPGSPDLPAWAIVLLATTLLIPTVPTATASQSSCTTERISVGPGGIQGNASWYVNPWGGTLSADGQMVVFDSQAANLVVGDSNVWSDVFVRDRWLGQTLLVSLSSTGAQGNVYSLGARISADGRCVVFFSLASNLVPNDTNGKTDVFVRDLLLRTTERVSVSSSGEEGTNHSGASAISADGRFVGFSSTAANLVPNDMNHLRDIFLHDRQAQTTMRVNVSSSGEEANGSSNLSSLSGDGRYVAFESWASNLVPGDTNGFIDVFVHDWLTGSTTRVSVSSSGSQGNFGGSAPSISTDGRFVSFESDSVDLVPGDTNGRKDIFLHDRETATTERVSLGPNAAQANHQSVDASISADGRHVAFESFATNLIQGGSAGIHLFVRDVWGGTTTMVDVTPSGTQGNSASYNASISADGRVVSFQSTSTNLVPGDTNGWQDVFVRDCGTTSGPRVFCIAKANSLGCTPAIGFSGSPSASAPAGFDISAASVLSQKIGLLLYGKSGPTTLAFQGGWLCVQSPLQRTFLQNSGGNTITDCSGAYHVDFNFWIASGFDPALVAGQDVWAQYWSRDPGFPPPGSTGLTDALAFTIGP